MTSSPPSRMLDPPVGIARLVFLAPHSTGSVLSLLSGHRSIRPTICLYVCWQCFVSMQQALDVLLQPFPGGTLASYSGWSCMIFNGVPVSDIDSDAIFSEDQILGAVRVNPIRAKRPIRTLELVLVSPLLPTFRLASWPVFAFSCINAEILSLKWTAAITA